MCDKDSSLLARLGGMKVRIVGLGKIAQTDSIVCTRDEESREWAGPSSFKDGPKNARLNQPILT